MTLTTVGGQIEVVGRSYYLDRDVKRIHFRETFKLLLKNAIIKGIKCERKGLML